MDIFFKKWWDSGREDPEEFASLVQQYADVVRMLERENLKAGVSDTDRLEAEANAKAPNESHAEQKCPACGGNDGEMPCAYPGEHERQHGCLMAARLAPNVHPDAPVWSPSITITIPGTPVGKGRPTIG